jgi:hypothetical protein
MTSHEAQRLLFLHWPGFMPEARQTPQHYFVRLVAWPPSRSGERGHDQGELQARSLESFESALRDLATFTPPLIRCRENTCVLCSGAG